MSELMILVGIGFVVFIVLIGIYVYTSLNNNDDEFIIW